MYCLEIVFSVNNAPLVTAFVCQTHSTALSCHCRCTFQLRSVDFHQEEKISNHVLTCYRHNSVVFALSRDMLSCNLHSCMYVYDKRKIELPDIQFVLRKDVRKAQPGMERVFKRENIKNPHLEVDIEDIQNRP